MAKLSAHPVSPPHRAPAREATGHLALRAYATFVLFSALAYSWWYNLLGVIGALALVAVAVLATLAIWIPSLARRRGPRALAWRRLPWAAFAYVALAFVSVAWSAWPGSTIATALVLAAFTLQGVFLADMLRWGEIVRGLEVALRWIVALSILFEAWVALILDHPILPNFFPVDGTADPHWYWVRGNFFDAWLVGDRIQGIVGNSNLLGMLMVVALIVFGVRLRHAFLQRLPVERIIMRAVWALLAAWLFARAGSATSLVAGAVMLAVLAITLVMRRQTTPRERTIVYAVASAVTAGVVALGLLAYDRVAAALGRDGGLTGRDDIWQAVLDRAVQHPVIGNGFASPWVPMDPAFDGWIVDHGITVFEAHNMWLDAFFQLGALGVAVVAAIYASAVWRAWFFAVDRPRWDRHASRRYSPLALVPVLVLWALLVQGLTESNPIMLWGWMLVVLFSAKLKVTPALSHPSRDAGIGAPA